MIEKISWISLVVNLIAVPAMSIIGILFHVQRKTRGSLVLASGFSAVLMGMIIEFIVPQTFETMEEATQVLANSGPPLYWFIDEIVTTFGIIITVIGFVLVVIEDKKVERNL